MADLDEMFFKYIDDNIKAGTYKTIGQVVEHFMNMGYSKEEINKAFNTFNKEHVSHPTETEYSPDWIFPDFSSGK